MTIGETIAWISTLLLALYGCAHLVRRICLWMVRCPRCAECWRLVIPRGEIAPDPLLHCLQAQAVWEERGGCKRTLLVLPELSAAQQHTWGDLLREAPAVTPVTVAELTAMLAAPVAQSDRKES